MSRMKDNPSLLLVFIFAMLTTFSLGLMLGAMKCPIAEFPENIINDKSTVVDNE